MGRGGDQFQLEGRGGGGGTRPPLINSGLGFRVTLVASPMYILLYYPNSVVPFEAVPPGCPGPLPLFSLCLFP